MRKTQATATSTSKNTISLLSRRLTAATVNGNVGNQNRYYTQLLTSLLMMGPRIIVNATAVGMKKAKGTTMAISDEFLKKFCNSIVTPSMPIPKNQSITKRTHV